MRININGCRRMDTANQIGGNMNNRFKNYGLWAAIVAQVMAILSLTGVLTVSEVEMVNNVIAAVLQILVTVGILINPTTPGLKD